MDSEKKKNPQGDGEGMCQKEKKKKYRDKRKGIHSNFPQII